MDADVFRYKMDATVVSRRVPGAYGFVLQVSSTNVPQIKQL